MKSLSKICDAADWFNPEIRRIILEELNEPPRFHRKQWEFAIIYHALNQFGFIDKDKIGLSLGGGNERVLYSIARRIKHLTVTDLYDPQTTWDCARTEDPDEFIKASKPFPVDDSKINAFRMDMRYLEFDDNTFDFCYSSCAIEHIGDFDDFVQHLNEVNRVLKPGGVYVFTTEYQFGNTTIKYPNNFIFSPTYLKSIFDAINLTPLFNADVSLSENNVHTPYPSNFKNLVFINERSFANFINENFPHIILLRGKYPFTSISFVMKKGTNEQFKKKLEFIGAEKTNKYLNELFEQYKNAVNNSLLSINPFSMLPGGVSRFYQDHAEFFDNNEHKLNDDILFHSDYFWLGEGKRNMKIKFDVTDVDETEENIIDLRVHTYATLSPENIECIFEKEISLKNKSVLDETFEIITDENYNYAILAKVKSGNIQINNLSITSGVLNNRNSGQSLNHNLAESIR